MRNHVCRSFLFLIFLATGTGLLVAQNHHFGVELVDNLLEVNADIKSTCSKVESFLISDLTQKEKEHVYKKLSDFFIKYTYYNEGISLFKNELSNNENNEILKGHIYYYIGNIYMSMNNDQLAKTNLELSVDLLKDHELLYKVYLCLGDLNVAMFNSEAAEFYLKESMVLGKKNQISNKEQFRICQLLINYYVNEKDIERLDHQKKKLEYLANLIGTNEYKFLTKLTEIGICMATGSHKKGFRLVKDMQPAENLSDPLKRKIFYYKGLAYLSEYDFESAIKSFEQSVQFTDGVKLSSLALTYSWYGDSFRRNCQYDEAISKYEKANELYKRNGALYSIYLADNYETLAKAHFLKGEIEQANLALLEAKKFAAKDVKKLLEVNNTFIYIYGEQLKLDYNPNTLEFLFQLMEENSELSLEWNMSRQYIDDDVYREWPIREFYKTSLEVLQFLYQYTKHDLVLERIVNYSNNIQSMVYNNSKVKFDPFNGSKIDSSIISEEKEIRMKIAGIKQTMKSQLDDTEVTEERINYMDSLNIMKDKYREFMMLHASKESKLFYNWPISNNTLKRVQKNLEKDEVIINYYDANEILYSTVITKDEVFLFNKHFDKNAEDLLNNYIHYLSKPQLSDKECFIESKQNYSDVAYEVYKFLLKDQLASLSPKIKYLTIILDDRINTLPFSPLLTENVDPTISFKDYPYLMNKYALSFVYSLNSFIYNKEKKRTKRKYQYAGFAPSYEQVSTEKKDSLDIASAELPAAFSDYVVRGRMVDIPSARKSIIEISDNINDGVSFTGYAATKEAFKTRISDTDILHFAMHTIIDEENPELSQFVFSGSDLSMNLCAYELYKIDMDIELAMLSACETGKGEIQSGKSFQSLSQAFSLAGASSITMSTYKIPDHQTSLIDQSFVQFISEGLRVDEALRYSKIDYLNKASEKYSHPFYWSGIILSGKTSPIYNRNMFRLASF